MHAIIFLLFHLISHKKLIQNIRLSYSSVCNFSMLLKLKTILESQFFGPIEKNLHSSAHSLSLTNGLIHRAEDQSWTKKISQCFSIFVENFDLYVWRKLRTGFANHVQIVFYNFIFAIFMWIRLEIFCNENKFQKFAFFCIHKNMHENY